MNRASESSGFDFFSGRPLLRGLQSAESSARVRSGYKESAMPKKSVVVESKLNEKFVIESDIRGHSIVLDQPESAGGTDAGVTPMELLFASLAGCIGTIGRVAAMQQRIELRGMNIRVEGDFDVDGLLGKPTDGRVGFDGITITVDIDADLTDEEKDRFIHEVDRRCPVSENLLNATPINVKLA
jgi:uncharacterized OsmC-like protein